MRIQDAILLVRALCNRRHLSIRTEQSYTHWLRRYGLFLKQRTPQQQLARTQARSLPDPPRGFRGLGLHSEPGVQRELRIPSGSARASRAVSRALAKNICGAQVFRRPRAKPGASMLDARRVQPHPRRVCSPTSQYAFNALLCFYREVPFRCKW